MSVRRKAEARQAAVFFALGDETRLSLVGKLVGRSPQSIAQLTDGTDVTRQAITKHLRLLQDVGLVTCRRDGRESLFEFDPAPLRELKEYLDRVSAHWDDALGRFKNFVED